MELPPPEAATEAPPTETAAETPAEIPTETTAELPAETGKTAVWVPRHGRRKDEVVELRNPWAENLNPRWVIGVDNGDVDQLIGGPETPFIGAPRRGATGGVG